MTNRETSRRDRTLSTILLLLLINFLSSSGTTSGQNSSAAHDEEIEYAPFDGWYNNFAHPDWGASDTPLLRLLPHAYSDGVYSPSGADRPNPIEISQIVFNGSTGLPSYRNRTALLVFFGQQVVEEILDAQLQGCPPEFFNIPIPKGHPEYDPEAEGGREMPFQRTRYDQRTGYSPNVPREQLNEISAYFDGSLMYGPHKAWADTLRSYVGGRLRATNDSDSQMKYFPALNDVRLPYPTRDKRLRTLVRAVSRMTPTLKRRFHSARPRRCEHIHRPAGGEMNRAESRAPY